MENNIAVIISAGAAAISALMALLSFLFSRRMSRRDMLDLMEIEMLQVVSSVQGREAWIKIAMGSSMLRGGLPQVKDLAQLLGKKYQKDKWFKLFLPAMEELKNEGYHKLVGW